jgi:CO/xanthine dehydrogenase FAD-binding subunit
MRMFKDFVVPTSLDEARAELKRLGPEGVPLAGASSLLFLKHKEPKVAVDLSRAGLAGICADAGTFVIGAMTTITAFTRVSGRGLGAGPGGRAFCHPADPQSLHPGR